MKSNDNKKMSFKGPHITPLMLLMLTRLHCAPPNSVDGKQPDDNRYDVYEAFLQMLLERTLEKDIGVFPDWALSSDKVMRDEFRIWLLDVLALVGTLFHMTGDRVDRGNAAVRKFDIALQLEMLWARDGVGELPNGMPDSWMSELDQLYVKASGASSAVQYEGVLMWLVSSVFGLVSTLAPPNGRGSLDARLLFGHRSFQEFLTTRALMTHKRRETLVVLREHSWASSEIVSNQWWDNVWLFEAARRGVVGVFELMMRVAGSVTLTVNDADDVDIAFENKSKGLFEKQRRISSNNNNENDNKKSVKFIW